MKPRESTNVVNDQMLSLRSNYSLTSWKWWTIEEFSWWMRLGHCSEVNEE